MPLDNTAKVRTAFPFCQEMTLQREKSIGRYHSQSQHWGVSNTVKYHSTITADRYFMKLQCRNKNKSCVAPLKMTK
jgi:hypothetical protein